LIATARCDGHGQDPVKAIVQDRFAPPEVLRLAGTGWPEAGPDDVLVRVHAVALNPADWHILPGPVRRADETMSAAVTSLSSRTAHSSSRAQAASAERGELPGQAAAPGR
jgi:hypothetical protein